MTKYQGRIIMEKNYLNARIKEKSTWQVISTVVAGITSIFFAPEISKAILGTMASVLALIGIFTKEGK